VTVSHFVDNPHSARIIAGLGFRHTGRTTLFSVSRNAAVEAHTYVLSRAEAAERVTGHKNRMD
jgi:RimJ/RimL family protein N-acetyltransferase